MKPISNEELYGSSVLEGIHSRIRTIQPPSNIVITSPEGRTLTLDFGGRRLEVTGDLELSEAAWLFFQYVHGYVHGERR